MIISGYILVRPRILIHNYRFFLCCYILLKVNKARQVQKRIRRGSYRKLYLHTRTYPHKTVETKWRYIEDSLDWINPHPALLFCPHITSTMGLLTTLIWENTFGFMYLLCREHTEIPYTVSFVQEYGLEGTVAWDGCFAHSIMCRKVI
jgi:hypothetical protein